MNVAFIVTKKGQVAKLNIDEIKPKNKGAGTVKGIKLDDGDEVASMQLTISNDKVEEEKEGETQ